jgi:2'-5' RNA ligase
MSTQPEQASEVIRVFVATPLAEAARHELAEAQNALRRIGADIKWVAPANIHLTLIFLGDIFANQADSIRAAIDQTAAHHPPCSLEIHGLGFFGSSTAPKVVWAGLRGDLDPLLAMQADLTAALKAAGLSPDTRKAFHPHLTLGRARSSRLGREMAEAIRAWSATPFGRLEVQNVLLIQSRLQPQGPVYSTLHTSLLTPG